MKTLACSLLLFALARPFLAQEPKVPEAPPPPELVGRWLEKTSTRKGDLVGYNIYCFNRQSEFAVVTRVRNEKTKKWVATKKLYPKERLSLLGYFESPAPGALKFHVVILAMAVFPFEAQYNVRGDTLTLSNDLFNPTHDREVHCARVKLLPGETPAEAEAFQERIERGLNGPDFRRVFEFAAHEMKDHPSDEEMIGNFIEHRGEFEKLRTMLQEDRELKRVDADWTEPKDPSTIGVAPERIAIYRELSRRVGLERGLEAFSDSAKAITFMASARGLSISGSAKSYVWRIEPPRTEGGRTVLVDDLDAYVKKRRDERRAYFEKHKRAMSNSSFDAYRHLDGNWYLEYDFED